MKTQNYKLVNSKAQVIELKRRKYIINNIDLGEQIDEEL